MHYLQKTVISLLMAGLVATNVDAASFIIKNIQIDGLQGISKDTVLSYLPIQTGQRFDSSQSDEIIRNLYKTGFFNNIQVSQQGSALLIKVAERPVVGSLVVTGNKEIPKDKLNTVLQQLGLIQGRIFDLSVLERVKKSLETEYDNMGKYNAIVSTSVTPEANSRVAIKIDISEGLNVQVKDIQIIGNHVFSTRKLTNEMTLSTHHFWSFITRGDQYTRDKLDSSIEALESYYLDHGYYQFKVNSTQATLTPDKKFVYLVFHVTEGPVYTFSNYQLTGNLVLPETKLRDLIQLKSGSVFSRQAIRDASEAITRALGNMGYAFANVNAVPEVNEKTKQISLTFYVDPGNRVYIHRINMNGNIKTRDEVLRRVMHQMEGSVVVTDDIKEAERQLNLTGFFDKVDVETAPVPGAPDQVDINYKVKEAPSAQAMAGIGYGTDGLVVNAALNQPNFLGTGNSLGLNFNNSTFSTLYSINYNNPYYTLDGVSRGFTLYAQRTTPNRVNISYYATDSYGIGVNYGIPLSAKGDTLQLGATYQRILIHLGSQASTQVNNFVEKNGNNFNQVLLNLGWMRNGLDKAFFPTKGLYQDAGIQFGLPGGAGDSSLEYFKLNYDIKYYHPITESFILTASGGLGYGNGIGSTKGLPFFANYFAGGIGYAGQVRGYAANSIGPQDSNGNALGGNIMTAGSVGIIFPNFISPDRLRTTAFVDAGNVRSTQAKALSGNAAGPLRYSTGLAIDWRVPVLNVIMNVSLAKALNSQPGDQTEFFQFNLGTSF